MARLPQPILESLEVTWPEGHKTRKDTFYKILGQAIRKRNSAEKRKEGGDKKK